MRPIGNTKYWTAQHAILQCQDCLNEQLDMQTDGIGRSRCTYCGSGPDRLSDLTATCDHKILLMRKKQQVVQCTHCGETFDPNEW